MFTGPDGLRRDKVVRLWLSGTASTWHIRRWREGIHATVYQNDDQRNPERPNDNQVHSGLFLSSADSVVAQHAGLGESEKVMIFP